RSQSEKQTNQQSSSTQTPVVREKLGTEVLQKTLLVSPGTTLVRTTVKPDSTAKVQAQNEPAQPTVEQMLNSMLVSQTVSDVEIPDIPNADGKDCDRFEQEEPDSTRYMHA
ncbi:hypothetical protein PoB_002141800, partial [Plakobranchus ocellatus]